MKKLGIVILTVIFSFLFINGTTEQSFVQKDLNKENVYLAIKSLGIIYPDVVFAQFLIESGNLESKLVRTNNNIAGMKLPRKRQTTATMSKHGYAVYDSWYSCVIDYKFWQDMVLDKRKLSKSQYLNYISDKYASHSDYKQRVKRVIQQNQSLIQRIETQ